MTTENFSSVKAKFGAFRHHLKTSLPGMAGEERSVVLEMLQDLIDLVKGFGKVGSVKGAASVTKEKPKAAKEEESSDYFGGFSNTAIMIRLGYEGWPDEYISEILEKHEREFSKESLGHAKKGRQAMKNGEELPLTASSIPAKLIKQWEKDEGISDGESASEDSEDD